jgi:hypothetical protein
MDSGFATKDTKQKIAGAVPGAEFCINRTKPRKRIGVKILIFQYVQKSKKTKI